MKETLEGLVENDGKLVRIEIMIEDGKWVTCYESDEMRDDFDMDDEPWETMLAEYGDLYYKNLEEFRSNNSNSIREWLDQVMINRE